MDLEASTRINDTLYFIGSHSNKKDGSEQDNREHLFAVTVSGTGANTQFTYQGQFTGLESALTSWDSSNAHGKGANYFGLTASSAAPVIPELVNGFSIEGMTASQDGTQLLLAFRAPLSDTSLRQKAIIVPGAVAGLMSGATPTFGAPFELDLGGRGIRSIEKAVGGGYLILAGPAGSASAEVTHDFRLYRWDGAGSTTTELDVSLDTLRDSVGGSFETIADVLSTTSGTLVQLLQDNGDTIWSGSTVSKDLPADQQKFQGNWVMLGADVTDITAPTLASSTPADNSAGMAVNTDLVLKFDEGVKAGAGSFVIKKASDNSVVETIAANSANLSIAYNTVTINPSADLEAGTSYYVEATDNAITDHSSNAWAGLSGAAAYNFATADAQTVLNASDVLFLGANGDVTDAFAFVIMKAITAGTQIGFTDRNFSSSTGMPASGESAYLWTADQNYAAGTIVTIQPDVTGGNNPIADKGATQGAGGGISTTAETVYAFQGSIAGLGNGAAGAITVDRLLASINVGGAAAGDIPSELAAAGVSISFPA
ncbi:MAG: Ig-like domain-containing protein, partial [Gallionellaceae bacterium]|nr:Ig-like domain-containing protein [Gallionellaceae bacterium]